LSTYIVCNSGWSKPVWNLLATIRKRYSERSKVFAVCDSGKPRLQQVFGLLLVVAWIVLDLLEQPPVGLVGGIVGQHVEDEPLLDRLAHAVEVEGLELPVRTLRAEELERLGLGGRRRDLRSDPIAPSARRGCRAASSGHAGKGPAVRISSRSPGGRGGLGTGGED
jgi:hypothetical protein